VAWIRDLIVDCRHPCDVPLPSLHCHPVRLPMTLFREPAPGRDPPLHGDGPALSRPHSPVPDWARVA